MQRRKGKACLPVGRRSNKIIAIDGPVGSGKSTIARILAGRLGFIYVDTGAMYRALTLKALNGKIDLKNSRELVRLAAKTEIKLYQPNKKAKARVYLDGKDVTKKIRMSDVTNAVSYIAPVKGVRRHMVVLQRAIGNSKNAVLEGRDIGTVVFPDADIKFYLDASLKERVKRRFNELKAEGVKVPLRQLEKQIRLRDKKDKTRKIAPLKKAKDAIYIDTTNMTRPGVVKTLLEYINAKKCSIQ